MRTWQNLGMLSRNVYGFLDESVRFVAEFRERFTVGARQIGEHRRHLLTDSRNRGQNRIDIG
jgi:hypothetical protein